MRADADTKAKEQANDDALVRMVEGGGTHDWKQVPNTAVSFDGGTFYAYECSRCGKAWEAERVGQLPDGPCNHDGEAAFIDGALWSARQFPDDAPFSLDDLKKASVAHFRGADDGER